MENAELEVALEELESRLERLRALYEQYFMGIERIEPAIPRKDVDRRIYVLRREKIRNTAKRFKLQTIISRYNTFQQYWQRICREIEQGTYKRHLIKAERIAPGKMLTVAARKRMGRAALEAMAEGVRPDSAPPSVEQASLPPAAPSEAPAPIAASAPAPGSPRLAPPPKPVPPAKPGARPPKPGSVTSALAPSPPVPVPGHAPNSPRAPFESLDLDLDFLGDWDPGAAATPAARRAPEVPARPFGKPLARPLSTPNPPPVTAADLHALRAPPPKPAAATPALRAAPPAPAARVPSVPPRPVAVAPRPDAVAPRPDAPPLPPMPARPAPPPPDAKPLAAPIPGASPLKPVAPRPPPPIAAKPAAPTPALAKTAAPIAPKPAAAVATPPDDRVRELHARLVEAKRQTHDTTAVSMEGLAKSIKATEAKLRELHKNRTIEFDIVIKDGKAVLKPIVR